VLAYVRQRQEEGLRTPISREFAALKRMFRLGEKAGKIGPQSTRMLGLL
jgi:hypothetical protein